MGDRDDRRSGYGARAPSLSRRGLGILAGLIVAGLLARLVVAFNSYGVAYDIDSFVAVRDALRTDPLNLYSSVNGHPLLRWPYPPTFLPLVAAAGWMADTFGLAFHGWVQVPQIIADGAIAWLVQHYLGLQGASERLRLAAAALVAIGPSFAVISGYHGQLDAAAILPAAAALVVWRRSPPGLRRALAAGALIGLAASIKTAPILVLAALLPTAGTWKERAGLVVPAVLIPLIALAPFLIADGADTLAALRGHRALLGLGGISLLAQPELARAWLLGENVTLSGVSSAFAIHQMGIVAALMAPLAALLIWRRVPPALAATLLWLAFLVLAPGFAFQYVVWGLPFALMAGYVWQVAAVQGALLIPSVLLYRAGTLDDPTRLYVPIMMLTWVVLFGVLVYMVVGAARRPIASRSAAG
jgi:hypothetical protein